MSARRNQSQEHQTQDQDALSTDLFGALGISRLFEGQGLSRPTHIAIQVTTEHSQTEIKKGVTRIQRDIQSQNAWIAMNGDFSQFHNRFLPNEFFKDRQARQLTSGQQDEDEDDGQPDE